MNLTLTQSLVLGFVSGLAEMLPISPEAHRELLCTLFGVESEGAFAALMIHVACLAVICWKFRKELRVLREAKKQMGIPPRRRTSHPRLSSVNSVRLLRSAVVIVVICRLFTILTAPFGRKLWVLSLFLAINGVILFLPSLMRSGNKDSRNMLRLDGLLMGIGAGLSLVPGISPVGGCVSLGLIRGVDRRYAMRFAYFLLIAGLSVSIGFDILALISGGVALSASVVTAALAGAGCAAIGCWLGLGLMQAAVNNGYFSHFCYYSWGMALVCLILYLYI